MNLTEIKALIDCLWKADEGISTEDKDRFLCLVAIAEAAMEVQSFGHHDGTCVFDEDDASSPCVLHVEAFDRRKKELCAALSGVTR